ncbi:MAG: M1 family metallopeptidase [Desulfobacterales bacterium]|jgi:tricorn protease interacting factor F2/3
MADFAPVHYGIRLFPDLASFRFSGRTRVRLAPRHPSADIDFNACDLAIRQVAWDGPAGETPCPFRLDPERETLTVFLPECVSDPIELTFDFEGIINDRMAGLYRSKFRSGETFRWIAVTQFQESDARRVFPCMDHPAHKATFDIELTVDKELTAISNTPVRSVESAPDGKKTVRFETTPKMSTYLLFMGVGNFETLQDSGDARLRAVTVPGMSGFADFGLSFAREALSFCESYFAIPYPLAKLDLLAVPDFAFGAMENWGAITFRENLLLRYPGSTSRAGLERICEVTAHEIVHQWFGNLVTPADWRYLWLNESFATYFAYGVVDRFRPEWRIWDRFIGGQTAEALERDGLVETFPIEIPGGEHVVINSSTAPIIYSKGGSILRQVEGFIGAEAFREGLRRYLTAHAYGNTHSHHLWEALEAVSDQPITRMMKDWIEHPGYPLLVVKRENDRLRIRQRRFSYLPGAPESTWLVPLVLRLFEPDGRQRVLKLLMEGPELTVDIDPAVEACKLNDGQSGFFRVRYLDEENLEGLGRRVADQTLSPEDRWGLAGDLYALLKAGRVDLDRYLSFLEYYRNEDRLLPLGQVAAGLHHLLTLLRGEQRDRVQRFSAPFFQSRLSAIGYFPSPDEPNDRSILRDQLLWPAALAGAEEVTAFGQERFDALVSGEAIDPEIFRGVLQIGAMTQGARAFSYFMDRLAASGSEHERIAIATAMGCFRSEEQIREALSSVLDTIPDRNKFIPVVSMAANPDAIDHLWKWYVGNRSVIERFHPLLYERVVASLIPACGVDREQEVTQFFADHLKRTDLAADAIRMAMERLRIDLALRRWCTQAQ